MDGAIRFGGLEGELVAVEEVVEDPGTEGADGRIEDELERTDRKSVV